MKIQSDGYIPPKYMYNRLAFCHFIIETIISKKKNLLSSMLKIITFKRHRIADREGVLLQKEFPEISLQI